MRETIEILGKSILVEWTRAAENALNELDSPLLVEMELLFSCLIRKAVRFRPGDVNPDKFVFVTPQMKVRFRPVMTKACRISDLGEGETPLTDFPIKKSSAFVPKYLFIDYQRGKWSGEFQLVEFAQNR
ncbi:hypothetical protein ACFDAU_10770 [Sulfuriferula sp. GW1]|uniref:hypothetical protein n=1 Tax=Sulfuriferula sp. GW1 TaxID=3345111 RepID=UPI0039AFC1AB